MHIRKVTSQGPQRQVVRKMGKGDAKKAVRLLKSGKVEVSSARGKGKCRPR